MIKRVPITKIRSPILMQRKLSNQRCSLCYINKNIPADKKIFEVIDCCGNKFIYINKFTNVTKRIIERYLNEAEETPYFYVNVSLINNLEFVYWTAKKLNEKHVPMYLETDRDLPEEILDLLGNNPFNVIQCNLSQISNQKEDYISEDEYKRIQALRTLPYKAKVNGLYVILAIDPIIPQITQLKNILITLTAEKNSYNHIIINFVKVPKPKNFKERDYVRYKDKEGNIINLDSDYFELKKNVWECAQWYKDSILENIRHLVKDEEIYICGETRDCRGIDLRVSIKTDSGGFKNGEQKRRESSS